MVCCGFVSLMLTPSYCCSTGCLAESLDQSVGERKTIPFLSVCVVNKGSVVQTFAISLTRRAIFPPSPVISSISSEAKLPPLSPPLYLSGTIDFEHNGLQLLKTRLEGDLPWGAELRELRFFFVSPPCWSRTPTQVVPGREKKRSSTPFSNSAHYARLDVNVHIWLFIQDHFYLHRLFCKYQIFTSSKTQQL